LLFHPLDVDAHAPPVAGSYSAIGSANLVDVIVQV